MSEYLTNVPDYLSVFKRSANAFVTTGDRAWLRHALDAYLVIYLTKCAANPKRKTPLATLKRRMAVHLTCLHTKQLTQTSRAA